MNDVYTKAELLDEAGNGAQLLTLTRLLLSIDRKRKATRPTLAATKSDSDEVLHRKRA